MNLQTIQTLLCPCMYIYRPSGTPLIQAHLFEVLFISMSIRSKYKTLLGGIAFDETMAMILINSEYIYISFVQMLASLQELVLFGPIIH
jgi:hypothetical protein